MKQGLADNRLPRCPGCLLAAAAATVSPEGASEYEGDGGEGPSPPNPAHRAFSSHHLQQMEMAAAMEGGPSSDALGGIAEHSPRAAHVAASVAMQRVHGLRDDPPEDRA